MFESPLNSTNRSKINRGMLSRALGHFSSDSSSTDSQQQDTPSAVVILPAPPYTAFKHKQQNFNRGIIGPLALHNPLNASTATSVKVKMPLINAFPTIKRALSQNNIQTPQLTRFLATDSRIYSPDEWRVRLRNGILSTALLKTNRSYSSSFINSDLKSSKKNLKLQSSKSMSNFSFKEMDSDNYRTGIIGKSLSKLDIKSGTTNSKESTKQGYFFNSLK